MTAKRRRGHRKTTINDVAARAGVSIKTVSRVLNREPKVRAATRAKVESVIEELRYRPNSPGRMLASRRSYILGLVYNANSSYINIIQNGALEVCRREHYDLLIHPCNYRDSGITEEIAELVTSGKVDGLILVPPISDQESVAKLLHELDIPRVSISRIDSPGDDRAIGTNDREVCAELTRHLLALGHRRIGFVRSHPDHKAMATRYLGYREGLAAAGLAPDDDLVVPGENSFESGRRCGERLLSLANPPTAVICANDNMAAGVMAAAHERGLDIPHNLSIAGFDDIPLASQVWPALTTVRQPLREMAGHAAELLIRMLRGDTGDDIARVVAAELVVRQSTGPAPGRRAGRSR